VNILAIDIGTHTGFCYNKGEVLHQGTWHLATPAEVTAWGKTRQTRRADPRICRFLKHVQEAGHFDAIVFEDVEFVKSRMQAHLWAGLRTVIWLASCQECDTVLEAVATGTLKKFATGGGGADKTGMLRALKLRHPHLVNVDADDNEIDATWLWLWAHTNLAKRPI
jgi:Holliday junction resolvasome RuvABC endonuclease subunit